MSPTSGQDLAFLARLSVASAHDVSRPRRIQLTFQGSRASRGLDVTLDTIGGVRLPTHVDQMVFLGLLQLALDPTQRHTLRFRRRELFDVLGWEDRRDGYGRLQEALARLQALLIRRHAPIVARDGRSYRLGDDPEHLVEAYDVCPGYNGECRVDWGRIVTAAFSLHDVKRLDWELVRALRNPLTVQLYRCLDRLTLGGHLKCTARPLHLAKALGMADYQYPSRCWQKLLPHLDRLVRHGYLVGVEQEASDRYAFHLRESLASQLRRALAALGLSEPALTGLMTGYDEARIMACADCFQHGLTPAGESATWIPEALKKGRLLRYPEDEAQAFSDRWRRWDDDHRRALHNAGVRLLRLQSDAAAAQPDPVAWPRDLRAVCRCIDDQALDMRLI